MLAEVILAASLLGTTVSAGSLSDIEHVVIFMQENRAWDTVSSVSWMIEAFH